MCGADLKQEMPAALPKKTVLPTGRGAYNSPHEGRAATWRNEPYFARSFWPHPDPQVVMAWTVTVVNALSASVCFCIRNRNAGRSVVSGRG